MSSDLEGNKIFAAILVAGVAVMGTGFVARLLVAPERLEKNAYQPPVAETTGGAEAPKGLPPLAPLLAKADPAAGEQAARVCIACHSFAPGGPNGTGPGLHGIVGREHASHAGYAYSASLKGKAGPWTYDDLNLFLHNPAKWSPGTKMSFVGIKKDQDRANVIAYLKSISPDAPPFPDPVAEPAAEGEGGGQPPATGPGAPVSATGASPQGGAEQQGQPKAEAPKGAVPLGPTGAAPAGVQAGSGAQDGQTGGQAHTPNAAAPADRGDTLPAGQKGAVTSGSAPGVPSTAPAPDAPSAATGVQPGH